MKEFNAVIDRIESDIAVLELMGGYIIEIPITYLPEDSKDGKVLKVRIDFDKEEEKKRIKKIKALQEKLKNKK